MSNSLKDTNAINKPIKGYKPERTPAASRAESDSAPNYHNLSMTPKKNAERTIVGQAQYGKPAKDNSSGQTRKGPQPKVSNRPALSREKGHTEPISRKQATLKAEKQRASQSQASSATVQQKPSSFPLKNRFDFPLTLREINQLRFSNSKAQNNKGHCLIHFLHNRPSWHTNSNQTQL
jgi:hypothetical protein